MLADVTRNLLSGFGISCQIFFGTLIFGIPLGLLVAFGSMNTWAPFKRVIKSESRFAAALRSFSPISFLVRIFIWIIRGTPLLLQLIVIFFGSAILMGHSVFERVDAAIITFSINYACYFAVIFRGGIESVPKGQQEAGLVLGMTKRQIFTHVTLLQLIKRIMPAMSNEVITLVKDTALARIIGVTEIIYYGYRYVTAEALIWPLFYTGVFFLAFNGILTLLFAYIEKRMDYIKIL
ncbi:amino acid ABC transporter permease [Clostridia bacterium]|nr:amino acid ABC transporter permease [Clostridia bacterium]